MTKPRMLPADGLEVAPVVYLTWDDAQCLLALRHLREKGRNPSIILP